MVTYIICQNIRNINARKKIKTDTKKSANLRPKCHIKPDKNILAFIITTSNRKELTQCTE